MQDDIIGNLKPYLFAYLKLTEFVVKTWRSSSIWKKSIRKLERKLRDLKTDPRTKWPKNQIGEKKQK